MLGDRIKQARKLRGRNQRWLAEAVGFTQSSLSLVEGNESGVTLERFVAIADALSVNMRWLATGQGDMESLQEVLGTSAVSSELEEVGRLYASLYQEQRESVLQLLRTMGKPRNTRA